MNGNTRTYGSKDRDGTITQGGYSRFVVVDEDFVIDVWGIGFDPRTGRPDGEPFRVTHHDTPGRALTAGGRSELAVTPTRLVVSLTETTGRVWLLDNLGR